MRPRSGVARRGELRWMMRPMRRVGGSAPAEHLRRKIEERIPPGAETCQVLLLTGWVSVRTAGKVKTRSLKDEGCGTRLAGAAMESVSLEGTREETKQ